MDGAIALVVLLVIVIFVVPIVIASSSNSKITDLGKEILSIKNYLKNLAEQSSKETFPEVQSRNELQELKQMITDLQSSFLRPSDAAPLQTSDTPKEHWQPEEKSVDDLPYVLKEHAPEVVKEPVKEPSAEQDPVLESEEDKVPDEVIQPEVINTPIIADEPVEAVSIDAVADNIKDEVTSNTTEEPEPEIVLAEPVAEYVQPISELPKASVAAHSINSSGTPPVEKKTDFEQFIGQKLMSIVGITILVLGIFFSVKWAIDRHLISDAGKIMIGIASGTILLGFAHKLVKNYRAFSSILAGGGIAVLYFSIYEAYQAYHLLSQAGAFGIMVFITLITVILSVIYDKKELAIIAIVGGFGTPFFVSNGAGNYQVLFTYLLILNVGMFVLASFKKWNLLNIICYGLTMVIFSGWVSSGFDAAKGQAAGGMLFLSLFFVTFFGMHIIYNLRHQKKFGYFEIVLLLSNSFIYLGYGLYFLHLIEHGKYQGCFTLALAAFNFVFAFIFYRRKNIDKNLVYLLIGMVLTFLSLTWPLQLNGNYITLFWACELVVMYWMGTKTRIELLKNASIVILCLTLVSLIMDWNNDYYTTRINIMTIVFNKAMITATVVCLAIFLYRKLIKKDEVSHLGWGLIPKAEYNKFLVYLLIALSYVSVHLEIRYQSLAWTGSENFQEMMLWIYHLAFMVVLTFFVVRKGNQKVSLVAIAALAFSLALYLVGCYSIISLRNELLHAGRNMHLFYWHYAMPLLALIAAYMIVSFVSKKYSRTDTVFKVMAWGITALVVFTLSAEAVNIWISQSYKTGFDMGAIAGKANKVALPIIWSVCSLVLMLMGMRSKVKLLRIISLSLFSLTIVKLFVYDISNVGQGGKIAAFIILGVILLVVSFMYQKIKGLFTDDHTTGAVETKDPNQL